MKCTGIIFYKSEFWVILICTICLQIPDLKIANLKISEILMLAILPFYINKIKKSKTLLLFTSFFTVLILKTFIFNFFTQFYVNDDIPFLKLPYFISISRLIEIFTCIIFCIYILEALKISKHPFNLIKTFLFIQIFFCGLVYIFVYFLYKIHVLHITVFDNPIVYDTTHHDLVYRLKGFYVEGGPFGLFYAFIFTICLCFYKKLELNLWYLILPVLLVLLASSKAGFSMLSLTIIPFSAKKIYNLLDYFKIKIALFILIGVSVIYLGTTSYKLYLDGQDSLEEHIIKYGTEEIDVNYMLGRLAASVIVPNMLHENWIKGIGWGNYPLIRNNPAYRSFMPEIPTSMWDLTGFGGMLDLFLEAGAFLFLIYIFLYLRIIRLVNKYLDNPGYITISYIGPLIFGSAIYFFYTWFLLGILLYFLQNADSR